jgi:hypothetical protein
MVASEKEEKIDYEANKQKATKIKTQTNCEEHTTINVYKLKSRQMQVKLTPGVCERR